MTLQFSKGKAEVVRNLQITYSDSNEMKENVTFMDRIPVPIGKTPVGIQTNRA